MSCDRSSRRSSYYHNFPFVRETIWSQVSCSLIPLEWLYRRLAMLDLTMKHVSRDMGVLLFTQRPLFFLWFGLIYSEVRSDFAKDGTFDSDTTEIADET